MSFLFSQNVQAPLVKKQDKIASENSGPSSLTVEALPAAYRRASEGGANLYMKGRKNKMSALLDKKNEI